MPAKLVYLFIVAIFMLALFAIFTFGVDKTGYKVADVFFGFVEKGGAGLQCTMGFTGNECSKIADESACTDESDDKDCIWCVGEVNGQKVSSCQARVCGCGNFRSTNVIDIGDMGEIYKPGDTIEVSGSVVRHGQIIRGDQFVEKPGENKIIDTSGSLSGLTVEYSFLDSGKAPTNNLGVGGTVKTDEKGMFKISHKIPENAPKSRYFLYVRFMDAKDWEDFEVG
jgi:hypothetical protein